MTETSVLFAPARLGAVEIPNRVLMAPMTRSRAGRDGVPGALAALYYAQRVGAGLIVTEATQVTPEGQGYIQTPGIHDQAQVAGWRKVTDAVHAPAGGSSCSSGMSAGSATNPSSQVAHCRFRPPPCRSTARPGPMTG